MFAFGKTGVVKADSIIFATGMKSRLDVAENLEGIVSETFLVGDVVRPRRIKDAIWEGFEASYYKI